MVHRISLLLLGDSRDRVLYGQTVGILCTGERGGCQGQSRANGSHTTAKHCYSWQWAAPARFPINSNWQSAGGALCTRASSHLAAFGYMLIYGVSSVGPYLHDWETHGHKGWAGSGWMDGEDGSSTPPRVDSASLAVEAAWRFATRAPADSKVCIVFSSLLWDLGRRVEHFPRQSMDAWSEQWKSNYTSIVTRLTNRLAESRRDGNVMLALSTPYDPPSEWKYFERHNATRKRTDLVAAHVRRVATERSGLSLIDWQADFRAAMRLNASAKPLTDYYAHPTREGVTLAFGALSRGVGLPDWTQERLRLCLQDGGACWRV